MVKVGTEARANPFSVVAYRRGMLLVLSAGICWSTIGLGVRLIEEATVWQILFYRSMALVLLLSVVMMLRSRARAFQSVRAAGISELTRTQTGRN